MRMVTALLVVLIGAPSLALVIGSALAGPDSAGPPAQDRNTAIGEPVPTGGKPRCPVTKAVFVRAEDKARFVADRYGVHVDPKFREWLLPRTSHTLRALKQ